MFYSTVTHNPAQARLVHGFSLFTGVIDVDTEYWKSLAAALRSFTELRTLYFWYTYSNGVPVAYILEGCKCQLDTFNWLPFYEPSLIPFLESQSLIKHLSLRWEDEDQEGANLSASALPNLRTLQGNQGVINAILPNRPQITHLHWVPELEDEITPDMSRIGPALSSIRVLQYGAYFAAPEFRYVVGYLANIQVLHWNNGAIEVSFSI